MGENLDARISRLLDQLELPDKTPSEIQAIKDKVEVLERRKEQSS